MSHWPEFKGEIEQKRRAWARAIGRLQVGMKDGGMGKKVQRMNCLHSSCDDPAVCPGDYHAKVEDTEDRRKLV
jgi:hypothetical protein